MPAKPTRKKRLKLTIFEEYGVTPEQLERRFKKDMAAYKRDKKAGKLKEWKPIKTFGDLEKHLKTIGTIAVDMEALERLKHRKKNANPKTRSAKPNFKKSRPVISLDEILRARRPDWESHFKKKRRVINLDDVLQARREER